jgi:hypothetical protein
MPSSSTPDGLQVAVGENGTAHLRRIEMARDFACDVGVRDGVTPSDRVILNPAVQSVRT